MVWRIEENQQEVISYVIMPNHFHAILYLPQKGYDLNKIIGNAKRLVAYEIIERLKKQEQGKLLALLSSAVTGPEKSKGQLHKVFEPSFDAKPIYNQKFFMQKFNYIHHNPVSAKWNLAKDYTHYEHSSASFYEVGIAKSYQPFDFRVL